MDKVYVLNSLKTHKEELKARYGLLNIRLFGSYALDRAD